MKDFLINLYAYIDFFSKYLIFQYEVVFDIETCALILAAKHPSIITELPGVLFTVILNGVDELILT